MMLTTHTTHTNHTASGDLLIHPTQAQEDRGCALLRALCGLDAELVQALEASQRENSVAMQDREAFVETPDLQRGN